MSVEDLIKRIGVLQGQRAWIDNAIASLESQLGALEIKERAKEKGNEIIDVKLARNVGSDIHARWKMNRTQAAYAIFPVFWLSGFLLDLLSRLSLLVCCRVQRRSHSPGQFPEHSNAGLSISTSLQCRSRIQQIIEFNSDGPVI